MPAEGREPSRTHSRQQCDRCGMLDGVPWAREAGGAVLVDESEARTAGALSLSEGCAAAANGLRDRYGGQQRPAGAFADLTCRDAAGGPWVTLSEQVQGQRPHKATQTRALMFVLCISQNTTILDPGPHDCTHVHLEIPSPWPTRRNPSRRSVSPSSLPASAVDSPPYPAIWVPG
jgi:hypothetical protein